MVWFEYLATKSELPVNLDNVKSGYIYGLSEKTVRRRLFKSYNYVLIVRRVK